MRRTAGIALALVALALAPASPGASAARPVLALTATPARVTLAGPGHEVVRITNPGRERVRVDVSRAGFSLDLRGRPKVVRRAGRRAATSWLSVRPRRFLLRPGASRFLTVTSRLPRRVEPGDHDALVLLTTRPRRRGAVAVRMRLGVVVVVRAPGTIVHRLALGTLRVRRARHARFLEVFVVNRGNVTETLARGGLRIVLRHGRKRAWLRAEARQIRPRSRAIVQLRYRGRLRGRVVASARLAGPQGTRPAERSYVLRL